MRIPTLIATLLLTACATSAAPLYGPATTSASRGYIDTQIEGNRWRVTFQGGRNISRDTVETMLLYRAAELTQTQGYDWFETVSRDTDTTVSRAYEPRFRPSVGIGYGRYYNPWWVDWQINTGRVDTETRVVATAEILMGKGVKPASNTRAYTASEVVANLRDQVTR